MQVDSLFNNPKEIDIVSYLDMCGIKDYKEFINPKGTYIEDPLDYKNMSEGVSVLSDLHDNIETFIDVGDKVCIICDSDTDGLCSSVLAYQFLKYIGVPISRIMVKFHNGKQHGIADLMDELEKEDYILIWIPDASSNDLAECRLLKSDILITDHHEAIENPCATVINNQLSPKINNKQLCGTGVTFKLIQAWCSEHNDPWHKDYLDLVAVANIADVMDMNNYENRTFNYYGLNRVRNPFLKKLCDTFIDGKVTPTSIAWNIAPKLNAIARSDNQKLKADLFKVFVGIKTDYDEVISDLKTCHSQQQYRVQKLYSKLIDSKPIYKSDKLIVIECEPTPYTGLVANKLMSYYKRPVFVGHYDGNSNIFSGSARSPVPIRSMIESTMLTILCTGHEQAFGIGFDVYNADGLFRAIENSNLDIKPISDVICSATISELSTLLFEMSEDYQSLWGHGLPAPVVHIKDIRVHTSDIKEVGSNGIKFKYGTIDFIKFGVSKEVKKSWGIGEDSIVNIEVVGELGINKWNGRKTNQIMIKEIEVNYE